MKKRQNNSARASGCAIICVALIMGGCATPITTTPKMNSNLNAQPVGAPQQFPIPNPPNDQFIWLKQPPVSSVVTSNPSGGNWALIVPKPAFLVDPDTRRQFLLASSEPFTTSPPAQMNGQFSVRLIGFGEVSFGIKASRGSVAGFVGGGALRVGFTGGNVGILLNPGDIDNLGAWSFRAFPTTGVTTYNPGQVVQFLYSIDQASHTFNLSVGGGAVGSGSATYSFSGPIHQLDLYLFLRQPVFNTQVFVNEVKMDEIN